MECSIESPRSMNTPSVSMWSIASEVIEVSRQCWFIIHWVDYNFLNTFRASWDAPQQFRSFYVEQNFGNSSLSGLLGTENSYPRSTRSISHLMVREPAFWTYARQQTNIHWNDATLLLPPAQNTLGESRTALLLLFAPNHITLNTLTLTLKRVILALELIVF